MANPFIRVGLPFLSLALLNCYGVVGGDLEHEPLAEVIEEDGGEPGDPGQDQGDRDQDEGDYDFGDAALAGDLDDGGAPGDGDQPSGDSSLESDQDPPYIDTQEYSYSCKKVGSTNTTDGVFSLATFNDKLYVGLFGYGHESENMVYRFRPWASPSPGLTGISESVAAMQEFDGYLFANTESSGDIFRSADGKNWQRMYNGAHGSIGCALEEFQGKLYAVNYNYGSGNHGRILRQDGSDWTKVYESGSEGVYIRELVAYNDTLYAFATIGHQPYMLSSTDGEEWDREMIANRYFRGHVWRGYLWLGAIDINSNGAAGIFRFDGSEFVKVRRRAHNGFTDLQYLDGRLFASTTNGWKVDTGPSKLFVSPDGENDWKVACTFDETAIWDIAEFEGKLYIGTWDFQNGGALYKLKYEPYDPTEQPSVNGLTSADACVQSVHADCTSFCTVVVDGEAGRYIGDTNGTNYDFPSYRFNQRGDAYCGGTGGTCKVKIACRNTANSGVHTFINPGAPPSGAADPGSPYRYQHPSWPTAGFLWKSAANDGNLAILLGKTLQND